MSSAQDLPRHVDRPVYFDHEIPIPQLPPPTSKYLHNHFTSTSTLPCLTKGEALPMAHDKHPDAQPGTDLMVHNVIGSLSANAFLSSTNRICLAHVHVHWTLRGHHRCVLRPGSSN